MSGLEQMQSGKGISVTKNDDCQVCVIRNETGEGVMTSYEIMDDIYLMYNDFHMRNATNEFSPKADIFCLDYCYEGGLEWSLSNGLVLYQKTGDLCLDDRKSATSDYYFPFKHYHGVTIYFFLPAAQQALQNNLKNFTIKLEKLQKIFTSQIYPYIIRNNSDINRIFKEIRNAREQNKKTFIKIKIFELLLYLDSINLDSLNMVSEYFYKSHVEKIKLVHETMINNLEYHYTLNELSEKFKIPLTPMTNCFKGVYGTTLYSYMREYRMRYAAKEILQKDISIAEAALMVGYKNPSKFSNAFKKVIGKLPKEYKKMPSK